MNVAVLNGFKHVDVTVVKFYVVDSLDRTDFKTSFKLLVNGKQHLYSVGKDKSILMYVFSPTFTVKIAGIDGYVDSATQAFTKQTLNSLQIAVTKKSMSDDALFNCTWLQNIVDDLDTHVIVKTGTSEHHVYYGNMSWQDVTTKIVLNIDARLSTPPPETISIVPVNKNYTYYYYVDNYSDNGKMQESDLKLNIMLYNEQTDPPIEIPKSPYDSNRYWNVCKIENGKIVVKNTITSSPDTNY